MQGRQTASSSKEKRAVTVANRELLVVAISKNPGNNFQKGCQQQQNKATNKEPPHPRSAVALGDKRKQQRDEPEQQSYFQDH